MCHSIKVSLWCVTLLINTRFRFFDERKKWAHLRIRSVKYNQGFWIYLYFRIRHSFAHLRPVILSADWSISRLQSWTCSSLPTVAEFVKLTQSIVIEIQWQSADLFKVHFCGVHSDLRGKGIRVSPADIIKTIIDRFETHLPLRWLPLYRTVGRIHGWNHNSRFATRSCPPTLTVFIEVIWAYNLLWVLNESEKKWRNFLNFLPQELNFDTIFETFVNVNWKCIVQLKTL